MQIFNIFEYLSFLVAQQRNYGLDRPFFRFLAHILTQTNIHTVSGIRNRDPSNQAVADPRIKQ